MALRLRRGTDAERLLITPVEGELIYTTDTKLLYVGDGTTAGGTLVTGSGGGGGSTTLDALTDTDLTGAANNDVLTFNGGTNKWEALAVPGVGALNLNDLNNVNTDVVENNQVLTYLSGTNRWEPTTLPEVGALTLNDLDNVNTDNVATWDVLQYDGFNFVPKSIDEALATATDDDGSIAINTFGIHTGQVFGNVDGDVRGSVFADDSTLLVDGVSGIITGEILTERKAFIDGSNLTSQAVEIITSSQDPALVIRGPGSGVSQGPSLSLTSHDSSSLYSDYNSVGVGDSLGQLRFSTERTDISGEIAISSMITSVLEQLGDNDTTFNQGDLRFLLLDGPNPANIYQARLSREVGFTAPVITPGTYADATARDAAITTPVAGMMVFLTDGDGAGNPKFQGYDGSAWVDLN